MCNDCLAKVDLDISEPCCQNTAQLLSGAAVVDIEELDETPQDEEETEEE